MNTSPKFYQSLQSNIAGKLDIAAWDESVELFKQKKYKTSFYKFLDYLDKDILKGEEAQELTIPHGSAVINIQLTDTHIELKARVMKINEQTLKIPLMRALCEVNFDQLELANATIKDNEVIFYYNFAYELASPRKLYDVIWDICRYADKYDDEFSQKFKTSFIEEPIVEQYTSEELDKAWNNLQEELADYLTRFEEYENDRNTGGKYFATCSSIKKIEFFLDPQGYTKTCFEEIIGTMHNGNLDTEQRIIKGKDFLIKLKDSTKETLTQDLYKVKTFTPEKNFTNINNIRENWETSYSRALEAANNQDFDFACMDILNSIYSLFSYNMVPQSLSTPLIEALESASERPWKESFDILMDPVQYIMVDNYELKGIAKSKASGDSLLSKIIKFFS